MAPLLEDWSIVIGRHVSWQEVPETKDDHEEMEFGIGGRGAGRREGRFGPFGAGWLALI
jgi:hypothetical protein